MPLLRTILPELEQIVGPQCVAVIDGGYKIEVEAVVSANGSVASLLDPALNV